MDPEKLKDIEKKWQKRWKEAGIFEADVDRSKEKFFLAHAYPYPSGPTHHGHARAYLFDDAIARYKRMKGFNVLYPMGWHCTGNPAMIKAEKIHRGDRETIEKLKEAGVPEEEVVKLKDPYKYVRFFATESDLSYKSCLETVGCSIDWRREFMTIDDSYKKFIQWQYSRLKELGYVQQKEYPVVWCPVQEMPLGDNDVEDESQGAKVEEYVAYKFKIEVDGKEVLLPAATLRPETVYGVTNMFLNPELDYVVAGVDDERWLLSRGAYEKMKYQREDVSPIEEFSAEDIIGSYCKNPVTKRDVIILPADFVKGDSATGVVMSVPAHAPYDHIAIEELKKRKDVLKKYDIGEDELDFDYIGLIDLEGYGKYPAVEVVEEMGIKVLDEDKLKKATKEVYRKEFHKGTLREITAYPGKKVDEIKDKVKEDMLARGLAEIYYDTSKPVVCKCGAIGVIKLVDDQWFLKYSDRKWKDMSLDLLEGADVVPDKYRKELEYYLDEWMGDKPCARKKTLGTELPFDKDWMVEPLSDSTVYMAYYTVSKTINQENIEAERLDGSVFDYVFWGKGEPENCKVEKDILKEMREEFLYWYPIDMRIAGTEHLSNHLSFMIFHHAALFDESKWPRGITIHGMVLDEDGNKVSASKGNGYNMKEIAKGGSIDAMRLGMYAKSSPWDDIKFGKKEVDRTIENISSRFQKMLKYVMIEGAEEDTKDVLDRWILSKMQRHTKNTEDAMERLELMEAVNHAFYAVFNDVKDYINKKESPNRRVFKKVIKTWIRILAPFAPHLCEELWKKTGGDGFVSQAEWPEVDSDVIDQAAERGVELGNTVEGDIREIKDITGLEKPEQIRLVVSAEWKRKMKSAVEEGKDLSELMEKDMFRKQGKRAAHYFQELKGEHEREGTMDVEEELQALEEMKEWFEEMFQAEVVVEREEKSQEDKAGKARPGKPAIVLKN